jgi:hypothetical protein
VESILRGGSSPLGHTLGRIGKASNVMGVEHADVLRESVAVMVREIMEAEIAQLAGAEQLPAELP